MRSDTLDPRPSLAGGAGHPQVEGWVCSACRRPTAVATARCARCGGELTAARFGPEGTVWSVTTVHIPVGDLQPPYDLAYVDLADDGPRILAHVDGSSGGVAVGDRVSLAGRSERGDPIVAPVTTEPSRRRWLAQRAAMSPPLPDRYNIAQATCDRWAEDRGRVAMLVPQPDGSVASVTFEAVRDASARLAAVLADLGIGRGDRVGVSLGQTFECAVSHIAIQRLGAVAVPVSVIAGSDALRHRLHGAQVRVLIAAWDTHGRVADEFAGDLTCLMIGEDLPEGVHDFEALVQRADPETHGTPVDTGLDDPALIIFTSGTTGLPKGALHAQRVVPAHFEPLSLAHGLFRDGDVLWSPADWAWGGGLIDCLFGAWAHGIPIVAWRPRGFPADDVLQVLARCGVTNAFLPPTALKLLGGAPTFARMRPMLRLRAIMTGGERCGPAILDWTARELGLHPNVVYGQTEVSCVIGNSAAFLPVRAGALGMEYPRTRAAILDDDGVALPAGEIGEIAFHRDTAAMFLGYWDTGQQAARPLTGEWHRTGDLGRIDEDGYFWHEGRRDDLILSSGYRIGPGEVEECLSLHPAVRNVAVVGIPDEHRGEVVAAAIELNDSRCASDALELELQDLVRARLAAYEVPRRFAFVEELPRTETGKVRRVELRHLLGSAAPVTDSGR